KLQIEVERMVRLLPQIKAFTLQDKLMQVLEERSQILSEFEQATEALTIWKQSLVGFGKALLRGSLIALNTWLVLRRELPLSAGVASFVALETVLYLSQEIAETLARFRPAQESAKNLQ